jgi:hypothetical protein
MAGSWSVLSPGVTTGEGIYTGHSKGSTPPTLSAPAIDAGRDLGEEDHGPHPTSFPRFKAPGDPPAHRTTVSCSHSPAAASAAGAGRCTPSQRFAAAAREEAARRTELPQC